MSRLFIAGSVLLAIAGCQPSVHEVIAAPAVVEPAVEVVQPSNGRLYPARVGDKFGYIDATGRMVIEPGFDLAEDFHEGLALVQVEWKPGLESYSVIDATGTIVLSDVAVPTGDHHFSEGLLAFERNGRTGFLERRGKVVIAPRFYCEVEADDCGCACEGGAVGMFENGVTWAKEGHKTFFIDRTGRKITRRAFDETQASIGDGLVAVNVGGKYGFLDAKGTMVIQPRYEHAGLFAEGLCPVQVSGASGCFFIDKAGRPILGPYKWALNFGEGYAAVELSEERWGLVDHQGKVTPIEGNAIPSGSFRNGLMKAAISTSRTKVVGNSTSSWTDTQEVFIDRGGRIAMRFEPSDHRRNRFGQRIEKEFDGQLAYIFCQDKGGTSGYVDRTGRFVWIDRPSVDQR